MAKRRKLEIPNPEDLSKLESEFRSETQTRTLGVTPPIAQVAAEAARSQSPISAEARVQVAKDQHDATAYREAIDLGLLVSEVALDDIDADDIMRDRTVFHEEEMRELEESILQSGLRLPIELYELPNPAGQKRYGLISGYRRLLAVRALFVRTQDLQYRHIKAFIRSRGGLPQALASMVEENEVRANLSHFERGRLVSLTVQNGVFQDIDASVAKLFSSASKSKRSKIRSFALVFEELGDVLSFPEALSERFGLRLAQYLKLGDGGKLREVLSDAVSVNPDDERTLIEGVMAPPTGKSPSFTVDKAKQVAMSQVASRVGNLVIAQKMGPNSVTYKIDSSLNEDVRERIQAAIVGVLEEVDEI